VTTMPGIQLKPGEQLAAGRWRVDAAQSRAWFATRVIGRLVRGRLPLTGEVLIAEPIESSAAWLASATSAVSTGSPVLDELLTGPGFLDAAAFPEISFRSDALAWVPTGWRALGRLQVKGVEHELACQLDLHVGDSRPGQPPCVTIASSWVIDPGWVTGHRIPALGHRVMMTCSCVLQPDG
jgi:polyisoprenoid-binding protein YceI